MSSTSQSSLQDSARVIISRLLARSCCSVAVVASAPITSQQWPFSACPAFFSAIVGPPRNMAAGHFASHFSAISSFGPVSHLQWSTGSQGHGEVVISQPLPLWDIGRLNWDT